MSIYYVIALLAMAIEGFAGFGGISISMPFLILWIPTGDAILLLSMNAFLVNAIVSVSQFRYIVWREYLGMIAPIALILPFGLLAFSSLRGYEPVLKLILGVIITAIALWSIHQVYISKTEGRSLPKPVRIGALVLGAAVQGMFSTGGSILALYTADKVRDKTHFRATLSAVWVSVHIETTLIRALYLHAFTEELVLTWLKGVPLVLAGMLVGMFLHKRVDNTVFRRILYFLLLAAGLTSLVAGASGLL